MQGRTRQSTRESTILCTIFVSRNKPFSTVITRNFRPASVLLRWMPPADDCGGGFLPRLLRLPRLSSSSSSIAAELRMSRLFSDWTRIASCLRSRYARIRVSRYFA